MHGAALAKLLLSAKQLLEVQAPPLVTAYATLPWKTFCNWLQPFAPS